MQELSCQLWFASFFASAAVVAPKTLLAQWRKELDVCGLGSVAVEYGGTANER